MTGNLFAILDQGALGAEARGNRKRKKKNKKCNDNVQQKILARCTSQIASCDAVAADFCRDNATCITEFQACCPSLATCEFATFFTCAQAVVNAPAEEASS